MTQWQPIETAPKDGTWVLICYVGKHWPSKKGDYPLAVAAWTNGGWDDSVGLATWRTEENETWEEATHWMPLPEPPK